MASLTDFYSCMTKKKLDDYSGSMSVGEAIDKGHMDGFGKDYNKLECICNKCGREKTFTKSDNASACSTKDCKNTIGFAGLKYCFRCAWLESRCRCCGTRLAPTPKKK